MRQRSHVVAVSGLVRDGAGRVLLVRNERGWETPGGQVEPGEDLLTALRREIAEEASCEVTVGRAFGLYSNVSIDFVILAFECLHISGTPIAGAECSDARWFEPEAAITAAARSPAADRIRDGLAERSATVFRAYERDGAGGYRVTAEAGLTGRTPS